MVAAFLHILEKYVCTYCFRHEIRRTDAFVHNVLAILVFETEVFLSIKNSYDIIEIISAYGIFAVAFFINCFLPDFGIVAGGYEIDFFAVGENGVYLSVVEIENIIYEFFFALVDSARFSALIEHHAYFFLGHFVVVVVGIYTEKLQYKVSRYCCLLYTSDAADEL